MNHDRKRKVGVAVRKGARCINFFSITAVSGGLSISGCAPIQDSSRDSTDAKSEEISPAENRTIGAKKDSPKEKESATENRQRRPPKNLPPAQRCGEHTCYRFNNASEALVPLILSEKARVVGFGEAHARAGFEGASTVRRFTEEILPTFAEGVSHLMVEILAPPQGGCEEEKKIAERESTKITKGQAKNNQNEYVTLGKRANEMGIVPDILRATCADLKLIASPDGGVLAYMEAIARLFGSSLQERAATTKSGRPLVLAYGGALHNDLSPREGRETWSYAPNLAQAVNDSFLEVDLIVPEMIQDSNTWKNFAWYDSYSRVTHEQGALLMQWGPKSYTLFFPPTPKTP